MYTLPIEQLKVLQDSFQLDDTAARRFIITNESSEDVGAYARPTNLSVWLLQTTIWSSKYTSTIPSMQS